MAGGDGAQGRIAVLGTGSWGTTLAILAARYGLETCLLARTENEAARLASDGENRRFLAGYPFPEGLTPTADYTRALDACDLLMMVVPSQTMRSNIRALKPFLSESTVVVSATKGLELSTSMRMTQVIRQELGEEWPGRLAAMSGPNLSREIVANRPATTVVASEDIVAAQRVQELFNQGLFRVYTNPDLTGVELAGSLKNIIAVAAGMADGLEAGDSAKAALITRGLAEIARLGVSAGASHFTFAGLAGLGDLIATCASPFSRNRTFGQELARGKTLEDVRASLGGQVAEGITTTAAARDLAATYNVEMPITQQLYEILFEGKPPLEGLNALLSREPTDEFLSLGVPGA
ncbi:MAG: NAD(P)H-dependent glycerol-3-phosphate dehydrogenase [Chloroflexia bacterium]